MPLRFLSAALFSLFALLATIGTARAGPSVYLATDGVAVSGYDTVAYFNEGTAVPGRPEFSVEWKGAVWQFASEENREAFEANPRAYAPQFGGYCAFALSRGYLADTDPETWKIVDGRLYLVHSRVEFEVWSQDIPGNLELASANWPGILTR